MLAQTFPPTPFARAARLFLLASAAFIRTLPAQSPSAAPTLELPVLVVDHQHRPVDGVHLEQLRIKAGNAAPFAPSALRREGDDPLSLATFIDASRDSYHDLKQLGDDLSALVGAQLLPADRISLYAADCAMTRSLNAAPPDAAVLRKAVADALTFPTLHGGKSGSACGKTIHLWDDVSAAVAALSHAPGRRVLLLISSGADGESKYDWLTIQQYAFDQSVAIFALRDQRQADADNYTPGSLSVQHNPAAGGPIHAPPPSPRSAQNLELLCANDGGLTLSAAPEFRKDALADILFLIRSRFILTISKDAYQPAASHTVKITQSPLTPYFFTATGASEPLAPH